MTRFNHGCYASFARRVSIIALGPLLVLQFSLLAATAKATTDAVPPENETTASTALAPATATAGVNPDAPSHTNQIVTGVRLSATSIDGAEHTYEVLLSDSKGLPVEGAELDLGALQADPDIRVPTTPLSPAQAPGSYQTTVTFPADGDWMLVVRVHSPTQAVELFTEVIAGAGGVPSHSDAANTPSRRALRAADPGFTARYNPSAIDSSNPSQTALLSAHGAASSPFGVDTDHAEATHGFDISTTIVVMAHAAAAGAWLLAVLGLVFANRLQGSNAQNVVLQFVARRYAQLAGGGLAVVAVTGLMVSLKASAGLSHPRQLMSTNLGIAYLALFGLKMVLVLGAIFTSWRIGVLMPTSRHFSVRNRLASVGAMVNDDPDSTPNVRTIFRLAETNMILAVAIISCVAILGQLHHALH